ncbi:MAG: right-handed parallel beta-helix repeat-containing protein, partial [Chitinophagaceae bacterium]|nr:right-handed parallel beta-helix repeat-containing protein [Chitinophagaceae bacterium]
MNITKNKAFVIVLPLLLCCLFYSSVHATVIKVGNDKTYKTIKEALQQANPGDTIIISKGIYKEGNIVINKPICIIGEDYPVLDAEFKTEVLSVKSSNVVIKYLQIQNSGRSAMVDEAAIKVYDENNIIIEGNKLINNFFGVHLQYASHCIVKNNFIKASQKEEYESANGIHCWKSDSLQIIGNTIYGHRDGIYFE